MREDILDKMRTRAFVVTGRHSWDRDKNDPVAVSSLHDAVRFLDSIALRIGPPEITGGTTAKPDDVIVLYWMLRKVDQIVGISIHFHGNAKCDVNFTNPDRSERTIRDLSIDELLRMNIPAELENMRDKMKSDKYPLLPRH